jgi:hypothetical protein
MYVCKAASRLDIAMHDRYALTLESARALRARDFARIDADAVAEELESMAGADAHELRSRVTRILEHLLKLKLTAGPLYDENQRLWKGFVLRQQSEIDSLLEESPSLKRLLTPELLNRCHRTAARVVANDLGIAVDDFHCPFGLEDVLPDRD